MSISEKIVTGLGAEDAQRYLLPGETQLASLPTTALVAPDEVIGWIRHLHHPTNRGQAVAVTGQALWATAQVDQPGGLLSLTNYRLLFVSHRVNLHVGRFSVFLPTIREVTCETTELAYKMVLETTSLDYIFGAVKGDLDAFIEQITGARAALTDEQVAGLKQVVAQHLDRVGAGLHAFWRAEAGVPHEEELTRLIEEARGKRRLEEVFGVINALELLHPDLALRLLGQLNEG